MPGSTINLSTLPLTFDDEFNNFIASPNGAIGWTTDYPFAGSAARNLPGTDEAQFNGDASIGVNPFADQNGILDITATVAAPGSNPENLPYNSGAINSFSSASQLYGYFEVRAEVPTSPGMWAAFWMVPTDGSSSSELDGFEIVGSYPGYVFETTHNTSNGVETQDLQWYQGINPATAFHTYGVDWEPTTITWYIDGVAVDSAPTPANMHTPMAMIVNLAIGGINSWAGPPTSAAEFPATMQIDDVRAYATANTVAVAGDEAILPGTGTAAIAGQVLYSSNGAPASAIVGYNVTLVNALGNVVANAAADSRGNYDFTGLQAGIYQIQFMPPAGEAVGLSGPANTATDLTAPITLAAGQSYSAPVETLINAPVTIDGQVLFATSSAGMALQGLVVQLFDGAGNLRATTTTDVNGYYAFSYLYAGSYQLAYAVPPGQALAAGGAASPISLTTGVFAATVGQTINLAPVTVIPPGASLTGQLLNTAGIAGLAGVGVDLFNAAGVVILTTTTNGSGSFLFSGLPGGTYSMQYVPPAGSVLAPTAPVTVAAGQAMLVPTQSTTLAQGSGAQPASASITGSVTYAGAADQGETVTLINSSGVSTSTTTNASGSFQFTGLAAGAYQVSFSETPVQSFGSGPADPTSGTTSALGLGTGQSLTLATEALIAGPAMITGSVQTSASGTNPVAAAGVAVTLLAGGVAVATTTSASGGTFQFLGITPGTYAIQYSAPAGAVPELGSTANANTGQAGPVTLVAGKVLALAPEQMLTQPATITGGVTFLGGAYWPMQGMTVELLSASGAVVASTVTNSSGIYKFSNAAAGTYQLLYVLPTNAHFYTGYESYSTGLLSGVTVAAGHTDNAANVGISATSGAVINGTVVYAAIVGAKAVAQAGVTVSLISAYGTLLMSTTTSSTGSFQFKGLLQGSYQLLYTGPAGDMLTAGGPANAANGLTNPITLGAGQTINLAAQTLLPAPTPTGFVLNGSGVSAVRGAGSYVVTGNAANSTLTLGSGNQNISLTGGGDTITVGAGNSTISALGGGNIISAGAGMNFITTDGSAANVVRLNAANQGNTTISGFNLLNDVLSLATTLAGLPIASNLANLGNYVTSAVNGANTILSVDSTGGAGTPYTFAVLNGLSTSVAALVADKALSLT